MVDLTHPMAAGSPVYPGTPAPTVTGLATIDHDGYTEKSLCFSSHTGTHIDAPAHMLPHGTTLDCLPPETFHGPACVVDITDWPVSEELTAEALQSRLAADTLAHHEFLLLHSGMDRLWGNPAYFSRYPVLSTAAARWLVGQGIRGVGIDAASVDGPDSTDFPVHHILLEQGVLIIENLTNLDQLTAESVELWSLPLKLANADGAPARVIAV